MGAAFFLCGVAAPCETKALNLGVRGSAPASLVGASYILWERIYSRLQVTVILSWGQLEKIPLIAVVVVVIQPVIDPALYIFKRRQDSYLIADIVKYELDTEIDR